jgi:hypothetical protein
VCAEKTLHLKGSSTFSEAIERITTSALHQNGIRTSIMNLFVPGSGTLLKAKPAFPAAIAGLFVSSIVYTCWYTLFTSASFAWMTPFELTGALAIPLLFHVWCTIFYLPAAGRHLRALLNPDLLKERSSDGNKRHPA